MLSDKEKRIIEELALIRNIIKYIVPEQKKKETKKQSKLEEEINKSHIKTNNLQFLDEIVAELKNTSTTNFSFNSRKEKDKKDDPPFTIKYQETEREQKIQIEAEEYSLEIVKEKPIPEKQPYQLDIIYENKQAEEKLTINYNLRDYPTEREKALQDFTNRADKTLHIFPKSMMGGILGFTYLGENFMGRRDDLTGSKSLMVDVHESIHTDNEYETRVLTDWMLTREKPKYKL